MPVARGQSPGLFDGSSSTRVDIIPLDAKIGDNHVAYAIADQGHLSAMTAANGQILQELPVELGKTPGNGGATLGIGWLLG